MEHRRISEYARRGAGALGTIDALYNAPPAPVIRIWRTIIVARKDDEKDAVECSGAGGAFKWLSCSYEFYFGLMDTSQFGFCRTRRSERSN